MPEFIADTPDKIEAYQFLARKAALSLEVKGLKRRGRSAYAIIKEVYGYKGSRQSVLDQMNADWDAMMKDATSDPT